MLGTSLNSFRQHRRAALKNGNLGIAATLLLCCMSLAAFGQGGLEVTLQVLDDVSGIDGVMMTIERASRGDEEVPAEKGEQQRPAQGEELPAARESDLGRELDREEESEGELDDFDVPEDVDLTSL
jgi:hypothetical protein